MAELDFSVLGKPRPKGSSKWVRSKSTGKSVPVGNEALEDWEAKIAHEARRQFEENFSAAAKLWDVPVCLEVVFTFQRPKSHHKSNDRTKPLRACAPDHPRNEADRDKLLRAVQDALEGVIYTNDKLVCEGPVSKVYGDTPGVRVWMSRMEQAAT